MFKLTGAAFLRSDGQSEIGFALFSTPSANFQYVAETDNYFRIRQFVPIIDTDAFRIVSVASTDEFNVGQAVPIPSISKTLGFIVEGVGAYINAFDMLSEEPDPLFRLELAAVVGSGSEAVLPLLREVRGAFFQNTNIGATWLEIEEKTRGASEVYWISLDQSAERELAEELGSLGVENVHDALYWLRLTSRFRSQSWIKVWSFARSMQPLSKELRDVSAAWLNSVYSDHTAVTALKSPVFVTVLLFACELSTTKRELDELYDLIDELYQEEPDILQLLVNSKVSHRSLVQTFIDHGDFVAAEHADYWALMKGYGKAERRLADKRRGIDG
ncbi:hypothetical protein [Rhizobium leguminosarum]|uniref:hypothetical protein n=1 Tax=Rhizobium leguminosarum TaxID=384 RepID=UPI003F94956C